MEPTDYRHGSRTLAVPGEVNARREKKQAFNHPARQPWRSSLGSMRSQHRENREREEVTAAPRLSGTVCGQNALKKGSQNAANIIAHPRGGP